MFINFQNDKQEILSTNYWESEVESRGYFYLSVNAGAFRLLVPESQEDVIKEIQTGKYCVISQGPSLRFIRPLMMELLFEDQTSDPYCLFISPEQMDRNISKSDDGKKCILSVWTKGCQKVLQMDAYVRIVKDIPYLKPLKKAI